VIKRDTKVVQTSPSTIKVEAVQQDPWILSAYFMDTSHSDLQVEVTYSDGTVKIFTEESEIARLQQKIQTQMCLQSLPPVLK